MVYPDSYSFAYPTSSKNSDALRKDLDNAKGKENRFISKSTASFFKNLVVAMSHLS